MPEQLDEIPFDPEYFNKAYPKQQPTNTVQVPQATLQRMAEVCAEAEHAHNKWCAYGYPDYGRCDCELGEFYKALTPEDLEHIKHYAKGGE